MKEILQIKIIQTLSICCLCIYSCIFLHSFHVKNVARDLQSIEVEDPEAEYQEEQQPEFEVADQVAEPVPEFDFTNSDTQQGKPRCILTRVISSIYSSMLFITGALGL